MRKSPTKDIEKYRIVHGPMASEPESGAQGAFEIPFVIPLHSRTVVRVIASDGRDWAECGFPLPVWEHVSVSLPARCPTWQEMDFVKRIFWRDDETVLQLHVPRSQHVNCMQTCLHLWKPVGIDLPLPPTAAVGPIGGAL